jgi:quinol monooxygenase YgiN
MEEAIMYGTIARLRVKPGKEEELLTFGRDEEVQIPGVVFQYVYRMDADPNEFYLVVGFESREAYEANAASPEQHARFKQYRAWLDADPEWHDGEIVLSSSE